MENDFCTLDNLELEMPLFKWGKKETPDVNYKSRVEQKLLLARQDPEPVFDLSDCNLQDVPSGVYSWCKVCLKQRLLLQNNKLKLISGGGNIKDLFNLRVIDLSHNNLAKIPDELCLLPNLQALYLNFNRLKQLPDTFNQLKTLEVLNLKSNLFSSFPQSICLLSSLRKLDISINTIHQLPKNLVNLKKLSVLIIDSAVYNYPPSEICNDGLTSILTFLYNDTLQSFHGAIDDSECVFDLDTSVMSGEDKVSQTVPYQNHHEALIKAEENLQRLYESLSQSQSNKHNFLKELIEDQDRIDAELSNAQNKQDEHRQKLVEELIEVEQESSYMIEELLEMSKANRLNDTCLETLENERKEFELLFMNVQHELTLFSKKEILAAMEETLENQYKKARQSLSLYSWAHKEMLAKTQLEELTQAMKLEEIMAKSGEDQAYLIVQLLQEEEYQKRAFADLLLKKDEEYIRLSDQISLIENELANLSLMEIKQRDLKMQTERDLLESQRQILTSLLIELTYKQENRSREFEARLIEIEARRTQEQADFWLKQYQKLLESKPDSVRQQEKLLNQEIKKILQRAGVSNFEPILAQHEMSPSDFQQMSDKDLLNLGVRDPLARQAILSEIKQVSIEASRNEACSSSSQKLHHMPSLKARFEVECVVCMERPCSVLYLNCGHVCCCAQCAPNLQMCPMCRSTIEKIFLMTSLPNAP